MPKPVDETADAQELRRGLGGAAECADAFQLACRRVVIDHDKVGLVLCYVPFRDRLSPSGDYHLSDPRQRADVLERDSLTPGLGAIAVRLEERIQLLDDRPHFGMITQMRQKAHGAIQAISDWPLPSMQEPVRVLAACAGQAAHLLACDAEGWRRWPMLFLRHHRLVAPLRGAAKGLLKADRR